MKKLAEFDRLVVFRLGKMIGVKGPGRVVILPWIDRTKRIDVRPAAFAVPPQQFITIDGGIVEMGAEIQYGIVDVVTMVSEVADHQVNVRIKRKQAKSFKFNYIPNLQKLLHAMFLFHISAGYSPFSRENSSGKNTCQENCFSIREGQTYARAKCPG